MKPRRRKEKGAPGDCEEKKGRKVLATDREKKVILST